MNIFATPIIAALVLASSYTYGASEPVLPRAGFIGVQVAPLESEPSSPEAKSGVQVRGVIEGGSAASAGLRSGDVILALDGVAIDGVAAFLRRVAALRGGDVASLEVRRDGAPLTLTVNVRPRPKEAEAVAITEYRAVVVDEGVRRTLVTRPPAPGRHPAVLYLTGEGDYYTTVSPRNGYIIPANLNPLPQLNPLPVVTIGGAAATVQYAGPLPGGMLGVMQINAVVPAGITVGNAVPVTVTVGGAVSQPGVTLTLK